MTETEITKRSMIAQIMRDQHDIASLLHLLVVQVARIEQLVTSTLRAVIKEDVDIMAQRETLDRMQAAVTVNTDAVLSAKSALEHFTTQHADDVAALKKALEDAGVMDEAEVAGAVAKMEANNATLVAAIPATAAAVGANTGGTAAA